MSTSKLTEGDLTPSPLPLDIMGRQTTVEMWEKYERKKLNHDIKIVQKREFLNEVLKYVEKYGAERAYAYFTAQIDMAESCDAPNPPDYTHAAND